MTDFSVTPKINFIMIPTTAVPNVHQILISFPDWVYAILSLGIFGLIFYLGSLHSNIKKVIKEFPKICRALDLISVKLRETGFFDENIYVSAASPIKLTPKGKELLHESGSDDFVNKYKDELIKKVRDKNPKTAYDVQIIARDVVENLRDDDRFSNFKDFVYKKGMPLEPIFIVMGIYLRDIALDPLGFKIEDIDNHDPAKKQNPAK